MKNKFWTALLSVVIAFGLWLYVVTVVSPEKEETYYDIPVVLQNEDVLKERGLMITSDTPTVTLKLLGNRSDLINLNEANINVMVNVGNIEKSGTHMLGYTVSYPGNVPINSVTKQQGIPDMISLKVENRVKKTVPVTMNFKGAVPEGFIADKENAVLDYQAVDISGPESVINLIEQAVVQVDLSNQNKTIAGEFVYTLCNKAGEPVDARLVTTNVEKINLSVKIQRVKEISLVVDVVDGGGATSGTCTIRIEPANIRVSGSDTLLENLDELNIGTINLGEMLRDDTLVFPITLPEGVTNETGVTDANVEVNFPDLVTKTLNVTAITPINVPEGMTVDMITQALEVKIRGPKEKMLTMTEANISVTVDFTGAQTGTSTMKATVTVGEGFAPAGAMGSYSVSATLKEP